MGLLYIFPDSLDDDKHCLTDKQSQKLEITSYPLPLIFYGYYLAIILTLIPMYYLVHKYLSQILNGENALFIDKIMAYLVYGVFIFIILAGWVMLSFKKKIVIDTKKNILHLKYEFSKLFSWKKLFAFDQSTLFEVFCNNPNPNMAKIKNEQQMAKFFNTGYFELNMIVNNKKICIDRSNQKRDLIKLKEMILCWIQKP